MACGIIRTLTIAFAPPAVAPANGYTVKWRAVGDTTWNVLTNMIGPPITIPGVPGCFNLEGTIEANCANGITGTTTTFAVVGSTTNCKQVEFVDTATYTYVECGNIGTVPSSTVNNSGSPTQKCVVDGTVTGGAYTVISNCT